MVRFYFLLSCLCCAFIGGCSESEKANDEVFEGGNPFVKTTESCNPPESLGSFFGALSSTDGLKGPFDYFEANEFLVDGVTYSFFEDDLVDVIDAPRNIQYEFHAWFLIRAVYSQALKEDDANREKILLALRDFVVLYAENNRFADNDYRTQKAPGFQWYDMGVGLRALTLGALLKEFSCSDLLGHSQRESLHKFAVDHVNYLLSETFHSGHNNHGAFQSAGSIGLCSYYPVLPNCDELQKVSSDRLKAYFDDAFVDGVHAEHSTGYMVYMVDLLAAIEKIDGLPTQLKSYLHEQLVAVSSKLQWFIAPDGSQIQIGDTDAKKFPVNSLLKAPNDSVSGALWLASNGELGSAPKERFWLSKPAGYAAVRNIDSKDYVLFTAAYHSRTHKHADDGNILWFTNAKPVLIDAGKYGYLSKSESGSTLREDGFWYADPKRVYVESNNAHNVVEVDGKSTNRRTATAYGGAVVGAATNALGASVFEMMLDRHEGVLQARTVIHQANRFVIVIDDLTSATGSRDYKQWFQFAPRFVRSERLSDGVELYSTEGEVVKITDHADVESVDVYRGQEHPKLQGWHSKEPNSFYPNISVSINADGIQAKLVTLIEYFDAGDKTLSEPVVKLWESSESSERYSITASDGEEYDIRIQRGIEYKIASH